MQASSFPSKAVSHACSAVPAVIVAAALMLGTGPVCWAELAPGTSLNNTVTQEMANTPAMSSASSPEDSSATELGSSADSNGADAYKYSSFQLQMNYIKAQKAAQQRVYSNIPDASALLNMAKQKQDMFSEDAWEGMMRLQPYSEYLASLEETGAEDAPGCEQCTENRLILEQLEAEEIDIAADISCLPQAWQIIANEFYDPTPGRFSQALWADELLRALKIAHEAAKSFVETPVQNALTMQGAPDGVLKDKRSLYDVGARMVSRLHDRYTELLDPAEFRRAVRRPTPLEREYYAVQSVGKF
eukprot:363670-Chlamydomonas_euryale.AAC.9